MSRQNLFQWVVEYHKERSLPACKPHMYDGQIHPYRQDKPLREGMENQLYKGFLIISNGETLVERLSADGVIMDHDPFVSIHSRDDFFRYLDTYGEEDGAFLYDGVNNRITRVREVDNTPKGTRTLDLLANIPEDFVSYNRELSVKGHLGTKTRLAIRLPHAYKNVETFQIKRSAYGPLGIGKATHFTQKGLEEEFFFVDAANYHCKDSQQGILGVYRRYERSDKPVLIEETATSEQYKPHKEVA